jgi:tetratricopeptide (TPR) repeat protein
MSAFLDRAFLLYQQGRMELAERELRQALAENPQEPWAHALLALCLLRRDQKAAATQSAEQAVGLAPDVSFVHYVLATVLHDRNRLEEAERAALEAVRLDPDSADCYAALASVRLDRRQWAEGLDAAELGVRADAEHVGCTNLRAIALRKLGRRDQAAAAIGSALARDPDSAVSHANQGWALLESGDATRALEHFREALRIDPQLEWAQQGIIEALKARHWIYAVFLRYVLWMSRLTRRGQWGVMLAGYLGFRMLRGVAAASPALAPWILPVLVLYVLAVFFTWIADPLFNLLLRMDRFGRLALSREQVVSSNWVGACLLAAMLAAGAWLALGAPAALAAALVFGFLVLPLSGTFQCQPGWPRRAMAGYTAALAAVGVGLIGVAARWSDADASTALASGAQAALLGIFVVGVMGSGWAANALAMVRPKQ